MKPARLALAALVAGCSIPPPAHAGRAAPTDAAPAMDDARDALAAAELPPDAPAAPDAPPADVPRPLDAPAPMDAPRASDAPTPTDVAPLDAPRCPAGQMLCPTTPFTNEPASAHRCRAPVGGACPAPDLIVGRRWVLDEDNGNRLWVTAETFTAAAPEITEGCVRVAGARRLLRFNFAAFNVGTENLNVGRPDERDAVHWEFFRPHGHWHVRGWGDLQLRSLDGVTVGRGRKLSFCLEDNVRVDDRAGPRQFPPPLCENFDPALPYERRPEFGLSVGWGDIYTHDLRCQFIDIGPATPGAPGYLADGFYDLALSINVGDGTPAPLYRESNYRNNTTVLRVEVRGMSALVCADGAGSACAGGRVDCEGRCAR